MAKNKKNDHKDNMEKLPKWAIKLVELIKKNWYHHGPCNSINCKIYYDKDNSCWQVYTAPAYQEIYGNEEDGKKVWTGFIFEIDEFFKEPDLLVNNFAVASQCENCNIYPEMMIKGKFLGHSVFIHIMLEPDKETPVVEIIDTIKKEIRFKGK